MHHIRIVMGLVKPEYLQAHPLSTHNVGRIWGKTNTQNNHCVPKRKKIQTLRRKISGLSKWCHTFVTPRVPETKNKIMSKKNSCLARIL